MRTTVLFLALVASGTTVAFCRRSSREVRSASRTPSAAASDGADAFLDQLEKESFQWFWDLADPSSRLVPERAPAPSPTSVAAVGFELTAYTVGAERGWVSREEAARRAADALRSLLGVPQGEGPNGMSGNRGFFYRLLDRQTGARFQDSELSTSDTAFLVAGALCARTYFDRSDPVETQIRSDADAVYRRVDWTWALTRPPALAAGWTPEHGFASEDVTGYGGDMILYLLALGSATHPIDSAAWERWCGDYVWGTFYGQEHVNASPLSSHQLSHAWVDFRGLRDAFMGAKRIDYFENSRRATLAQRAYAGANPAGWEGYGVNVWGLTGSDGPFNGTRVVEGHVRTFRGFALRGASLREVVDDGTIAPSAATGSIPFAPELAVPALREMWRRWPDARNRYGFVDAFNPTLGASAEPIAHGRLVEHFGWFAPDQSAVAQGITLVMIENHRTGFVWQTMRKAPELAAGLGRAGFTGGWLGAR